MKPLQVDNLTRHVVGTYFACVVNFVEHYNSRSDKLTTLFCTSTTIDMFPGPYPHSGNLPDIQTFAMLKLVFEDALDVSVTVDISDDILQLKSFPRFHRFVRCAHPQAADFDAIIDEVNIRLLHTHTTLLQKEQYRIKALEIGRDRFADDELEFDDSAVLADGQDNGAFLQAWKWIPFDGTELDKEASTAEEDAA